MSDGPHWCNDSDDDAIDCDGCTGEACGHPNMEYLIGEVEHRYDD